MNATSNPGQSQDYPAFVRAGAETICPHCGLPYRRHPHALEWLDYQDRPWLRRLCDGRLVKL